LAAAILTGTERRTQTPLRPRPPPNLCQRFRLHLNSGDVDQSMPIVGWS
jgi:hypothetical protein